MAKSDFLKDAKEAYKKRFPKKNWDSLSDSTKKKYYYEAMRLNEQRTGEAAYTQVSGSVSFSNEREFFAEAFAIYEKDGILSSKVKNFIEEVLK